MTDARFADLPLETMRPNPAWDAAAHASAVDALGVEPYVFRVWGGDWCGDCRARLPDLAAALAAAGVPRGRLDVYPVERVDGEKSGPGLEAYGVDRIPTVVVEGPDGNELARYVEDVGRPIAPYLAERLSD